LNKGALAVLAEKEPAAGCSVTWIQVPDSRLALAQLSTCFFQHPSRELLLTGVTGTCGKTTISSLINHIYYTADLNSGLIGTVQIQNGSQSWAANMTTPDALELQKMLRLMVNSGVTHAAMEVSSHGLAQKRVNGTNFRGCIFTNISPNHLDFHQDVEEYAQTKKRLASLVETGGFILANGDDPFFRTLKKPYENTLFFFGEDPSCDFHIHSISSGLQGSSFKVSLPIIKQLENITSQKDSLHLHIPLLGRHNVYNAAAAAAAALLINIQEENIIKGLASFRGVERRMQLYRFHDLYVIDDTAMSPGSIDAVFNTLEELPFSDLVIVNAIRGSRGTRVNEDNGRFLARWSKNLKVRQFFSTSSISHVDERNKVLPEEEEAFFQGTHSLGVSPKHFGELPEAITQALKVVKPGTTLLLLGAQGMNAGLATVQEQLEKQQILVALS